MKKRQLLIFILFIIVFSFILIRSPIFGIKEINTNELTNFSKDELLVLLDIKIGDNMFERNLAKAKSNLKNNPFVVDISIKRLLPNTIEIFLTERETKGYVPYLGTYLYIDAEGMVLNSSNEISTEIPIFIGLEFDSFKISEKLETANKEAYFAVIKMSNLLGNYDFKSNNIRVDISNLKNIHLLINEVDVVLGDISDCDNKIRIAHSALLKLPTNVKGTLYLNESKGQYRFVHLT